MSPKLIIQLLGGVGIFLFAIRLISESLQLLAGDRLRQLISALTKTSVMGVLLGAFTTVLVQSSSATTVMTVSFVDAGLMSLNQAIGIIMGANIGTTITGQIVAIKVKDYAYLFIIVGVLLSFFGRAKSQKYLGSGLLGFGLLFVGMQTMESSMYFLRDRQDIFLMFSSNPVYGILAGTILTLLVQSSSATVGLTIALGMQGLLPLDAAIPIILGDNIGTTITAVLASIGTTRTAKQACAVHVLFNVIGVVIFTMVLPFYTGLIKETSDSIGHQIANAHTLFNVGNTLLFLPFVNIFARFVRYILPDIKPSGDFAPKYLNVHLIEASPASAVEAVKNECGHMASLVLDLLDDLHELFFKGKVEKREAIDQTEHHIDILHKSIGKYVHTIWQAGLADDASKVLRWCRNVSRDIEHIGDHGIAMLRLYDLQKEKGAHFSQEALHELDNMFAEARYAVRLAVEAFISDDMQKAKEVMPLLEDVRTMESKLRRAHLQRLDDETCNPDTGLIFIDILSTLEHTTYQAYSLAKNTIRINKK